MSLDKYKIGVVLLLSIAWISQLELKAQEVDFTFMDPSLSIEDRTEILVSQMTLDEKISQLVNHAEALPRFNIPEYDWWNEALHGIARNGKATVFPQAIG